jgi:hypothetical protein
MAKRGLKLQTRYNYLLRDAKTMTFFLENASAVLSKAARKIDGVVTEDDITPSDVREWSSECARIAHQCGRQSRLPRRRR